MQDQTQTRSSGQLLSLPTLSERLDTPAPTIRGWVSRGIFPKPLKITARCARWRLADVEDWEQRQVEGVAE